MFFIHRPLSSNIQAFHSGDKVWYCCVFCDLIHVHYGTKFPFDVVKDYPGSKIYVLWASL